MLFNGRDFHLAPDTFARGMTGPQNQAVRVDASYQPNKIIFARIRAISRRKLGSPIRMGVIAADDFALGPAQAPHQAKMLCGIELETIRLGRKIANGMNSDRVCGV